MTPAALTALSTALHFNFLNTSTIGIFFNPDYIYSNDVIQLISRNQLVYTYIPDVFNSRLIDFYTGLYQKPQNHIILLPFIHMKVIFDHQFWSPHGKTIVIVDTYKNAEFLFKAMRKGTKSAYIVALVMSPEPKFYTQFPYYQNCDFSTITEVNADELFPVKVPRDFKGCPVSAATSILLPYVDVDDGVEINLFKAILHKHNAVPLYKTIPNNGTVWDISDPPTGGFKMLAENEIEALFSSLDSSFLARKNADILPCHTYDSVRWFVPLKQKTKYDIRILKMLPGYLWIGVLFFLSSVFIIITLAQYVNKQNLDFPLIFFKLLSISMNLPTNIKFGWNTKPLLLFTYIFAMHITCAYQSSVLTKLCKKEPTPLAVLNIEEIAASKLYIYYHSGYEFWFKDLKTIDKKTFDLWTTLTNPTRSTFVNAHPVQYIAEHSSTMLLGPHLPIATFTRSSGSSGLVNDKGELLIQPLPDFVFQTNLAIWLAYGHPMYEMLSMATLEALQAGLPEFWMRKYDRSAAKFDISHELKDVIEPLGLTRLSQPFAYMKFLVLAIIVFVLELVVSYIKKYIN